MTKPLDKPPRRPACAGAKRPHKGWPPERRARQAEIIRTSKPWKKSKGPRTQEGKARSASNALKHGFRSRPFVKRARQERQLIRDAAQTIALAKHLLRSLRAGQSSPLLRPEIPFPPPPLSANLSTEAQRAEAEALAKADAGEVPSTISCKAAGGAGRPCLAERPPP